MQPEPQRAGSARDSAGCCGAVLVRKVGPSVENGSLEDAPPQQRFLQEWTVCRVLEHKEPLDEGVQLFEVVSGEDLQRAIADSCAAATRGGFSACSHIAPTIRRSTDTITTAASMPSPTMVNMRNTADPPSGRQPACPSPDKPSRTQRSAYPSPATRAPPVAQPHLCARPLHPGQRGTPRAVWIMKIPLRTASRLVSTIYAATFTVYGMLILRDLGPLRMGQRSGDRDGCRHQHHEQQGCRDHQTRMPPLC